jgi:Leucine-rich repeat (LRR) protein
MKWLTRLNLTNNRLSVLPTDIDKLVNLKELILERNQLSTLPITVGYLSEVLPSLPPLFPSFPPPPLEFVCDFINVV